MKALWRHVRGLWPGLSVLAPVPFSLWAALRFARGEGRWEHAVFLLAPPLLAFASQRSKRLFVGLFPFMILALVYDAMFLVKNVGLTPERVHVCDLRAFDTRLFGLTVGHERISVHDWLQSHATLALDLFCAIPYGTFLYASVAFAIFLWVRDFGAMNRFGWTFLAVNLLGFVTYHLYPAAPPWYFHSHGCLVDLAARASEGPNLARVDAWLGFPYFASFYGRSNDVFGAVPSLHVTYPLLISIYGYPYFRRELRALSLGYFVLMCFSAVYLDHHWVTDVLLGISYVVAVEAVQRWARSLTPLVGARELVTLEPGTGNCQHPR